MRAPSGCRGEAVTVDGCTGMADFHAAATIIPGVTTPVLPGPLAGVRAPKTGVEVSSSAMGGDIAVKDALDEGGGGAGRRALIE